MADFEAQARLAHRLLLQVDPLQRELGAWSCMGGAAKSAGKMQRAAP